MSKKKDILKLYPYSKGDPTVGVSSWLIEITIDVNGLYIHKEDIDLFKEKIKEMFEKWDCDGVQDEDEREELERAYEH